MRNTIGSVEKSGLDHIQYSCLTFFFNIYISLFTYGVYVMPITLSKSTEYNRNAH